VLSRKILASHGCTAEAWRKKLEFAPEPAGVEPKESSEWQGREKIDALRRRIRTHVEQGRLYNLQNWRTLYALRQIWDTPSRSITPTLLNSMIAKYGSDEAGMKDALKGLGLNIAELFTDTGQVDVKNKQPILEINAPVFFSVVIPLVRSYLEIRWAKVVNDRNLNPRIKFESATNNPEIRAKCDLLTNRGQVMSKQYNHLQAFAQGAFQMLLCGRSLQFTQEEWHFEEQMRYASKEDVRREKLKASRNKKDEQATQDSESKVKEGDEIVYTVREGLRPFHPDPAHTFWDQAHPMHTFNTDTGCEHAGFWRVVKYGELLDNPDFYNQKRLSFGGDRWWETYSSFFNLMYPCSLSFPTVPQVPPDMDREQWLATNSFYGETEREAAVVTTEIREKIIPSQYGLGTYDYPIWARFVVAGDGTIIYGAPVAYRPVLAYRVMGDNRKTEEAGVGTKLIPFQDQLSMLLSQFILAAKQNLTNLTLLDENVVDKTLFSKIRNIGEKLFRGINFHRFDSKKLQRAGIEMRAAVYSHRFPQLDTKGIIEVMKVVLDLAERVLQFSNQEIAQQATHEQSKREVELIQQSTGHILAFAGIPLDEVLEAQGYQYYEALMNYGDDDFYAEIPTDNPIGKEDLEKMGITYAVTPHPNDKKALVLANRSAMELHRFSVVPNIMERRSNIDAARAITEMVRDWFINNPIGLSVLGPEQLVELANYIAKLADLPLERPIRNVGLTTQEQNLAAQQQLKSIVDKVLKDVQEGTALVLQEIEKGKQLDQSQQIQIDAVLKLLNLPPTAAVGSNESTNPTGAPAGQPPVAPPEMAIPAGGPAIP